MKMINHKTSRSLWLMTILLSVLGAGCDSSSNGNQPSPVTTPPVVISVTPADMATEVLISTSVSATFGEAMNASTLNEQNFTLMAGVEVVVGAISLDAESNSVTFTPANDLNASTLYTVMITSDVTSALGVALANNNSWRFTTAGDSVIIDIIAPIAISSLPADAATEIALNANISASFSEALDPATVNANSFTVSHGDIPVVGVVSYAESTVTFNPTDDLLANTLYTATLTTEITDLASSPNPLAANHVWSFTSELSTPTVTLTNPRDTEIGVAINHHVVATFSESMDPLTINEISYTLMAPASVSVTGIVTFDVASNSAIFQPTSDLVSDTIYTATITTAAMSSAGMALAGDSSWHFTTAPIPDVTAPTVVSTDPLDTAIDFPLNRNLVVEFSEALHPSSVNSSSFIVTDGVTPVAAALIYSGTTVTFNPTSNLAANTLYTATLTTGITDLATPANPIADDYIWRFTTDAAIALGPDPVNLRSAKNFVILTKAGTTNVHSSAITGNLGASPITAAAMDNVFCHEITGIIYGSDAAYTGSGDVTCFAGAAPDNTLVANAVLDMTTAYNDAAGRTLPDFTELHAGDISGQTLTAGLYKWSSGVLISTDVTLTGGANDVWIFQVSGDVTQANASRIILAGGALSKNVFWQVAGGSGVVIGTNAHFSGVVLAQKAITVNTGASVDGRLFAHTAVTLDQNTVTQPAP